MAKYKIKKTKKLIKQLKPYWRKVQRAYNDFYDELQFIEEDLRKKVRKDLDIFMPDGYPVGIGNDDRTMPLIHDSELT